MSLPMYSMRAFLEARRAEVGSEFDRVPVIVHGGAFDYADITKAVSYSEASGVAVGSMVVSKKEWARC